MSMLYSFLRFPGFILIKLLFRLEVRGRENIPPSGAFILASNHVSYLDPVVLGVASSRPLYFMARSSLFTYPGFGWLIRNLNAFPTRRDEADPSSIRTALECLKQGKVLVIFPEGGRSKTGQLGKAHPGIGLIAARADVPVVPVSLAGTDKALPRQAKFIRPHKISAHFSRPLFFNETASTGRRSLSYQSFADRVMASLAQIKTLTK